MKLRSIHNVKLATSIHDVTLEDFTEPIMSEIRARPMTDLHAYDIVNRATGFWLCRIWLFCFW